MRECTMSAIEIQKRAQAHANEGTESQGLMFEREYTGRIYLPSGCWWFFLYFACYKAFFHTQSLQ